MKSTPSSKAPFLRCCHTGEKKGNDIFFLKGPEKLNPGIYQVLNGEGESPSENPGSPHCMLEMAHTRAARPPPSPPLSCAHMRAKYAAPFHTKRAGRRGRQPGGAFERPLRLPSFLPGMIPIWPFLPAFHADIPYHMPPLQPWPPLWVPSCESALRSLTKPRRRITNHVRCIRRATNGEWRSGRGCLRLEGRRLH